MATITPIAYNNHGLLSTNKMNNTNNKNIYNINKKWPQ